MATRLIERAEALLVRLALRDDHTLSYSAVDTEAAKFAHGMLWVSIAPAYGTVLLTGNGQERLLARGIHPPPRRQERQERMVVPSLPLGGIELWSIHGPPPTGHRIVARS